jgi:hypothetical protein
VDVIEVTWKQDQPQFLYLITKGWKTGRNHIWFVSYDRYYIVQNLKKKQTGFKILWSGRDIQARPAQKGL